MNQESTSGPGHLQEAYFQAKPRCAEHKSLVFIEGTEVAHRRERKGKLAAGGDREVTLGRPEQQPLVCGLPECSVVGGVVSAGSGSGHARPFIRDPPYSHSDCMVGSEYQNDL